MAKHKKLKTYIVNDLALVPWPLNLSPTGLVEVVTKKDYDLLKKQVEKLKKQISEYG